MDQKQIIIIGGGVGGLSTGWQIAKAGLGHVTILEKEIQPGGVCRTIPWGDHWADLGPHKVFSVLPGVMEEILTLFSDEEIIRHQKRNRLFLLGQYLDYPVRITNLLKMIGWGTSVSITGSLFKTKLVGLFSKRREESYEDYVVNRFGRKLYRLVFEPLALKVWGDPRTLSKDIAETRIPASGAVDVLLRAAGLKKENANTNAGFFYYPREGFGAIPARMQREIEKCGGVVKTGVADIQAEIGASAVRKVTWTSDGQKQELPCDLLISSIPFPALLRSFRGFDVKKLLPLAEGLPLRHTVLVYLAFDTPKLLNDHWVFVSDPHMIFSRIYEPKVLSPQMGPQERTVVCCDLTAFESDPQWGLSDEDLAQRCEEGLRRMRVLTAADKVKDHKVVRIWNFYPRYEVGYREKLAMLISGLSVLNNIICTGRLGLYNYNNLDHCLHMGMTIAAELKRETPAPAILDQLFQKAMEYRIVD
ncbi:MAG TPA: FAD-dependent oxidoreductase [Candidatus Omnitrophota bacterium]|nr:FAD-dependent oxidoreductase [Candidatus Omnitrophota bacterium]HPB68740.1 FAD-dependent oxidoreductase [Candidatus Omnitrophota bacterium]HQO58480.1 FAD-dependent oxidoreductase [Candidatus Omnitrophota bacterium]